MDDQSNAVHDTAAVHDTVAVNDTAAVHDTVAVNDTAADGAAQDLPRPYPIPTPRTGPVTFSHPAEAAFAQILDFYQMKWEYEPMTFPLEWDEEGNILVAFSPDFYLVDDDMYVELTTMKQSLVTKKNRKLRRLQELYPGIKCKLMYRKDIENLAIKYGLFDQDVPPAQAAGDENEDDEE